MNEMTETNSVRDRINVATSVDEVNSLLGEAREFRLASRNTRNKIERAAKARIAQLTEAKKP